MSHVTSSVGWLGAVLVYLVVAIVGLTSLDLQRVRATYLSMDIIAWFVIVPLAIAALMTGLVQSLGTPWGLFRHYWVLIKFSLTLFGTAILLLHAPRVSEMAIRAAETSFLTADYSAQRTQLVVHAAGGLVILLAATALSIFKPWGKTRYGRGVTGATKRYVLLAIIGVVVLLALLHLKGGGPRAH